jgi:hypothetical protein
LPAAGSTLKSSGAAGDYRKIRELLVGGSLADVLVLAVEEKMAKDGVEREGGDQWTSKEPREAREVGALFGVWREATRPLSGERAA